jgi:hypothetical protein
VKKSLALVAVVFAAACSDTSNTTPTELNLDRPVDVSFACYGGLRITNGQPTDPSQTIETSAQPVGSCDFRAQPRGASDPEPRPPGQEDVGTSKVGDASYYAFILESAPGTVAIAQWATIPTASFTGQDISVLDANSLTPGRNGITVGDFPIAIATDKVGCYEITANAGSCDMSSLKINDALAGTSDIRVDKLTVKNGAGVPLRAKAAAMVMEPPGGTIGVECPMAPTGIALVAYPSCHLVAAIDTSTATVVGGLSFSATGVATKIDPATVTCPDECNAGALTPGVRPVALDLVDDPVAGNRLAIGADNFDTVWIANLDGGHLPQSAQSVALEDKNGALGVSQVALTPQIGMGGFSGVINDTGNPNQFQFVYAVATDGTVRAADVLTLYKECDTQVDPRYLIDNKNVKQMSCMPVGDAATPPRRAGAIGPGIAFTGHSVPTSVAVFRDDAFAGDTRDDGPNKLIGYFGVITTTTGESYLLNIDDDNYEDYVGGPNKNSATSNVIGSSIPLVIAHQLRDALPGRDAIASVSDPTNPSGPQIPSCDALGPDPDSSAGNGAGPRAPTVPQRTIPSSYVATDKVNQLPSIRQVLCGPSMDEPMGKPVSELMFPAPLPVRQAEFPDLRALRLDENWTLTWEGLLSQDSNTTAVNGPTIRTGNLVVDSSGFHLVDATAPFCNAGVETDDIVQLRGCDPTQGDAQCPLGYTCYVHPESKVTDLGACIAKDEADRLANACKEFLTSFRTYTVGHASTGEIILLPRKHVLRTTPIDGCTSDQQCQTLANLALQQASLANPVDDTTPPDPHTYSCTVDPDRGSAPIKRCIQTCQMDSDCGDGLVCQNNFCMEGVTPPQACVNAPQRFDLRSHEAFTVVGTESGYVHSIIADASGNCVRDPKANPLQIGRIPLSAPACDPTSDPRTGIVPATGAFEPNPCETTVAQTEIDPVYLPGTCTPANPSTQLLTRQATAIRFRNRGMTLTIVDPTYPGDAVCNGDRGGTLGLIPTVASLFQLVFRQTAGFAPLTLDITPTYPIKVVRGPYESIWVIDAGDFLSQSLTEATTQGKVFRVESTSLGTINTLE